MCVSRVFSSPQWKSVLQGAAVSEETEQLNVLMAAHTCQLLLQDTTTVLDQVPLITLTALP